jgi:hypothetical protein
MVNFLPYGQFFKFYANKKVKLEKDVEICLFCDANLCKLKLIFQRGYNVKSSTGSNLQISL